MTESVAFPLCALVGWWMASLHTACRETVPNSAQSERYVCYNNAQRACSISEPVQWKRNHILIRVDGFYLRVLVVVKQCFCFVPIELRMQKAKNSQVWMTRRPHTLLMWVLLIQSSPCSARFACTLKLHVYFSSLVCIGYSLRGKPRLACPSSTWAMRSWEVGSWDWRTPWPTQGSSCFCESSIRVWYI